MKGSHASMVVQVDPGKDRLVEVPPSSRVALSIVSWVCFVSASQEHSWETWLTTGLIFLPCTSGALAGCRKGQLLSCTSAVDKLTKLNFWIVPSCLQNLYYVQKHPTANTSRPQYCVLSTAVLMWPFK